MKDATREGLHVKNKKEEKESVTEEEEELFWNLNLLGMSTAKSLLNTFYLYNGKLFGLRGPDQPRIIARLCCCYHPGIRSSCKTSKTHGRKNRAMEGEEESSLDVSGDDIDLGYEERPVNRYGSPIALPESADYEEAGPSRAPPSRVVSSS